MRFDDMEQLVRRALDAGEIERAQVLATMAVAERLDRLCALQSGGADKPPAVRYTCPTGTSAAPPRW